MVLIFLINVGIFINLFIDENLIRDQYYLKLYYFSRCGLMPFSVQCSWIYLMIGAGIMQPV